MEMRDPRMHRCVAWTIAMVILDFMKLDVSGQDLRDLTSLVRRLHVHIFTLLATVRTKASDTQKCRLAFVYVVPSSLGPVALP